MKRLPQVTNIDKRDFKKRLNYPHDGMLKTELGLEKRMTPSEIIINFRSIRRYHANRWELYYKKCMTQGHLPMPSPLQHCSETTAKKHYLDLYKNALLVARQQTHEEGKKPDK